METYRTCSWCHATNSATERFCGTCGHKAHVARLDCSCPKCNRCRRLAAADSSPVPLSGVIEAALAALRRKAPREEPSDGAAPTEPEGGVP